MSIDAKSYRESVQVKFTFPAKLQGEIGYKDVTIRELSKGAESQALARAGLDGAVMMHELAAASVVSATKVDGTVEAISTGDESIDKFLSAVGPKGRALIAAAYGRVNQPQKEDLQGFLEGGETSVG